MLMFGFEVAKSSAICCCLFMISVDDVCSKSLAAMLRKSESMHIRGQEHVFTRAGACVYECKSMHLRVREH